MNPNAQAFPSVKEEYAVIGSMATANDVYVDGLKIRDYIAIEAMKGLIAIDTDGSPRDVAEVAYMHADALMAESNKK